MYDELNIFCLDGDLRFPDVNEADPDGLLACGGDLSIPRLLEAYSLGIFPWFNPGDPILWWSPDPRMVLYPDEFRVTKNLKKLIDKKKFQVTFDQNFSEVIWNCSAIRRDYTQEGGSWITDLMIEAYENLHRAGFAHSVETWLEGRLVGGLYGVSLGRMFFGESMFHKVNDASKVALFHLVQKLKNWQFDLIDAQQDTQHLRNMGGRTIPRKVFLHLLSQSLTKETISGSWAAL